MRRNAEATAILTATMGPDDALREASEILDEQRSRLSIVQRNDLREAGIARSTPSVLVVHGIVGEPG